MAAKYLLTLQYLIDKNRQIKREKVGIICC